ncbi:Peptidase family M23 [Succiniclasticum ruminis]|uniref:Peptidase family M23 n=2 Tax=Succiniclasticum ruminis TaxID=40841 RepID=A0A1G6KA80_9FIRM|nr:Peptidase family M23 [Succiniclasticum ruminis]
MQHNFNHTGESMEENTKLEELNTEPVVQLIIPRDNGQEKIFSVTRKKGMTLAGLLAVVFVCLAGAAGFYGWQYHHTPIDKTAYREYLDHKSEQEAKLQSLLEDNEKMLRDMSEIHTLETKLRRAVIQNSGDREFSSSLDSIGAAQGVKSTDPSYSGKGGPGADISMLDVAAAQNKNLTAQIDQQKKNMHELLTVIEGRNNRLSTLPDLWPTDGGVISSYYGGRTGPINGGFDWHPGLDIAVDIGTPVYAAAMGTVDMAGWNGGYGQFVKIRHGNGYESAYGHMSGIAVSTGQQVRKGEIIGFVGSTGYSTGPHLHFEVFVDGENIDPLYMLKKAK